MKRALYVFLISVVILISGTAQDTGKKRITNDSFKLPQWGGYRLSPDNSRVAFTKRERDEKGELTPAHVFIYDLSTRRTMQLTNSDFNIVFLRRWTPNVFVIHGKPMT